MAPKALSDALPLLLLLLLGGAASTALAGLVGPTGNQDAAEIGDAEAGRCAARSFGYGSVACACNAASCDEVPGEPDGGLRAGQLLRVVSTRDGLRLRTDVQQLLAASAASSNSGGAAEAEVALRVGAPGDARQEMLGFGAALTDSAAQMALSLGDATRRRLLEALFGPTGARFTLVRVPMAGTDFSTRNYTYDDGAPDPSLSRFALAPEDTDAKIPVLQAIRELAGDTLRLFTAPWSAPAWMVQYDASGLNHLLPEYEQTWADYFIKFLQAYAAHGLPFWGLTPQNEPSDGYVINYGINRLGWKPERMRDWLRDHLGPTLRGSGYGDLKLMIHDDQRARLPGWAVQVLNDSATSDFVSGIAVHWYTDFTSSPELLTETHNLFPNKFLLYTEACDGNFLSGGPSVQLGNWTRAENYASDIIQASNNWVTGWVDWNLALDTQGGPTWANNNVDAGIIVNATADEFLKQPTYYALTHFSRYVPPGSRSLPVAAQGGDAADVSAAAFLAPDGSRVLVVLNRDSKPHQIAVSFTDQPDETYFSSFQEHSITTLIVNLHD